MATFLFSLNDNVIVSAVNKAGVITGRAEFVNGANGYLVRYKTDELATIEAWVREPNLASPPPPSDGN